MDDQGLSQPEKGANCASVNLCIRAVIARERPRCSGAHDECYAAHLHAGGAVDRGVNGQSVMSESGISAGFRF